MGNISQGKRSSLNAILLVAIINSKHLKKYGMDPIREAIVNDIKLPEQVLTCTVHRPLKKHFLQ